MAGLERDDVITLAIKDCEREGIMTDFVREHGTEAVNMIFTQFNMEDALKYNYEEGVEDGVEIGEMRKLIQMVCKKVSKGKALETIAEELEEELDMVQRICAAVEEYGTDVEKICDEVM